MTSARPTTSPLASFDLPSMLTRALRVAGASATLVANVLGHTEKLVFDVISDSFAIAREAEALSTLTMRHALAVREVIRATPRFTRIVRDVLQVVAAYRLAESKHRLLGRAVPIDELARLHEQGAEKIHTLCAELGGGVLKLGQFASTRRDLLPDAYSQKLSLLQDQAPAAPTEAIIGRIEEELGAPIDTLFGSFEAEPLGTASLAQVHRATLPDGTPVAVKIQLPGVDQLVEIDLAAFRVLGAALDEVFPNLALPTFAETLSRSVREELDYTSEAENAEMFRTMLADSDEFVVPCVYRELSSERVLTLEFIEGERLLPFLERTTASGELAERDALLARLARSYARQVLRHGIFHADPHPGNFLVLPGGRLALLDFGSVQHYTADERDAYRQLLGALLRRDIASVEQLLGVLGFEHRATSDDGLHRFVELALEMFALEAQRGFAGIDPSAMLERALALVRDNPIVAVPHHFVLLGKVLTALGGLFMHYRPELNLLEILVPYLS